MALITRLRRRPELSRSAVFRLLAFHAYQDRPGFQQRFIIVSAVT